MLFIIGISEVPNWDTIVSGSVLSIFKFLVLMLTECELKACLAGMLKFASLTFSFIASKT